MSLQREQQTVPNGLWAAVACVASGAVVWIGCMYNNLQNEMLKQEKEMKAIEVALADSDETLREVEKAVGAAARGNRRIDMEQAMRAKQDLLEERQRLNALQDSTDRRCAGLVYELSDLRTQYNALLAQMSRGEPPVDSLFDHSRDVQPDPPADLDSTSHQDPNGTGMSAPPLLEASLPLGRAAAGPEALLLDSAAGGSFHKPPALEAQLASAAGGSLRQQHAPEARVSDLPQSGRRVTRARSKRR